MRPSQLHWFVFVALFALAVAACGGGHSSASGSSSGGSCAAKAGVTGSINDTGTKSASSNSVDIEAQDVKFSPTCTTSVPTGTVTLTVHNTGGLLHNLSVPDQNIDRDVPAGATITVRVKVGTAPVTYFCKYHRGSGMVGFLIPATA
jgi:plastocyanin